MDNLKMRHIIIEPQFPCNTKVFVDEWVEKYSDWFRNNTEYCSVFLENAERNAHLDICAFIKDSKTFENKSRSLKNLNAKFCAQNIATQPNKFYKKIPCNEDDILYVTGYNHKEERCVYSNLPEDFTLRAKEYYAENEKLKRVRKFQNTNPLNVKNVVCYLLERSEDLSVKDPWELTNRMVHEGFSFVALAKKPMRKAILEFKTRIGTITEYEKSCLAHENGCFDEWSNIDEHKICAIKEIVQGDDTGYEDKLTKIEFVLFGQKWSNI